MKAIRIGVDLAKSVFQVHGASMSGQVQFRKKLSRPQFMKFMAEQPAAVVVMEACGSASYWAREMIKMGHEAKPIAPQYVKPFVRRQKNDAADAEAIVDVSSRLRSNPTIRGIVGRRRWQRPEMRFVPPKTEEQQARAVIFRARERLAHQRTELTNALRAMIYEYGHAVPQGPVHLKRIVEIIGAQNSDLPELVRQVRRDLIAQIAEKTARIDAKTKKIAALAALAPIARRLQTMPGVGPPSRTCFACPAGQRMTALAIEAFAPAMATFVSGRDFAAWLGLVPRQMSSGGKERLGRISKAGQADIRCLLIIGAASRLNWLGSKSIREGAWLARLRERKPKMLVAIALANKMARAIWAMLTKQQDYRDPVPAGAV